MSAIDKAKLQLTKCAKCVGCSRLDDEKFRGDERCTKFVDASTKKEDLVKEYNVLLPRLYKAIEYIDGPISEEKKNRHFPEFLKLKHRWEEILRDFDTKGYEFTEKDVLEGFKEDT